MKSRCHASADKNFEDLVAVCGKFSSGGVFVVKVLTLNIFKTELQSQSRISGSVTFKFHFRLKIFRQ